MTFTECPIVFDCEGEKLVGIATQPARPHSLGVLIVVGGPQYRAGSHRSFVHLSRALASAGFPALRFDYRGMGDSSGEMRTFESVEPDLQAAAAAFRAASPGTTQLVLFGLCDAASAALMAAARIDGLAGLILANPWVRQSATLNAAIVRHYYRQRVLSVDFWRKLLTGRLAIRSAGSEFASRLRSHARGTSSRAVASSLNFVDQMRTGWSLPTRKLLILSGHDLTAREFEDVVRNDARWNLAPEGNLILTAHLPDADHTFSSLRAREEMHAHCLRFLKQITQPHPGG